MEKVFISHSWNDNSIAEKIYNNLKFNGAEIWIDYVELKPGEELPKQISQALEWCDTLLVIWSESAAKSHYVGLEWQAALDMHKRIILCLVDNAERPAILRGYRYIDFKNFRKGYEQLLCALDLEAVRSQVPSPTQKKPPRPRRKIPTQQILKYAAILVAVVILGLTVNYVVQKIAADREAKRVYWQKYQTRMNTRFQQAQQSDGDTRKSASDKLQIWQQFLTDFATDNPYSQQDNDERAFAERRKNYWATYQPPQPQPETRPAPKGINLNLVLIRGGTFNMGDTFGDGDDDEKPVHSVTVSDFYMGKTEVTVAQYRDFCQATGRQMPSTPSWGWQDDHPMVNVSWYDAVAFCRWAGCRLPTEAEWEYAAREGGREVRFGNGKNIADPAEINFNGSAEYKKNYSVAGVYRAKTTPVASFTPNALGLYDMSGNVWEWCSDWYDEKYYRKSLKNNPTGPASSPIKARVLRGGSWSVNPVYCRSSYRNYYNPEVRNSNTGFRVAQDSPH